MTEGLDPRNGAYYVRHVASQKDRRALLDDGQLREENGQLVGLCVQVTRRLHGHPKMLELAVGVALQGRVALEQTLVALPDELEQQLAAMLATSLRYLGSDGQRALPLLGFFPTGSATPKALEVVARVAGDSLAAPMTPDTAASEMAAWHRNRSCKHGGGFAMATPGVSESGVPPGWDLVGEVLQLYAEGYSAKDVAKILHISSRIAENHKAQIMAALGARSTADLVRWAIHHGLIAPT